MDRRTFIQGTTTAALTASATSQVASASPSEFVVGGIPLHVVERIYENFGDGGFTCLPTDDWKTAELGLMVFRHFLKDGEPMELASNPMWPIFDQPCKPQVEEVSAHELAELLMEASPDDVTVAMWDDVRTREVGLLRYDLQEHVAHLSKAGVGSFRDLDQDLRKAVLERRRQIVEAWGTRLARRDAEAEQLTRDNPWEEPERPSIRLQGPRFSPGQELGKDDLQVFFVDEAGDPLDPDAVTYVIEKVEGGSAELIGPERTPVRLRVGVHYAALYIPPTASQGVYRLRWKFLFLHSGGDQEIEQLFSIVRK
jgi:hypothetical protein